MFSFEVTDPSTIQRYFARFDEKFFQFCDKELVKINTFFLGKIFKVKRVLLIYVSKRKQLNWES